jgi:hypothetical protein
MERVAPPPPPVLDSQLAHAIAAWVLRAPREVFTALADGDWREAAADSLGEMIVAELTMAFPEFVEAIDPAADDQLVLAL